MDRYKEIPPHRGVRPHHIGAALHLIHAPAEGIPDAVGRDISPAPDGEPFCACDELGVANFIVTLNPDDFPQLCLCAHVILPGKPIPITARTRPH